MKNDKPKIWITRTRLYLYLSVLAINVATVQYLAYEYSSLKIVCGLTELQEAYGHT